MASMSFTTVPDKATGDVITEAMWDVIKDNMNTALPVFIASTVLGSDTASITLSAIPALWKHLLLLTMARSSAAVTVDPFLLRFNGDTGANYDWQTIQGDQATMSAAESFATTSMEIGFLPGSTAVANSFAAVRTVIMDYTDTGNFKALISSSAHRYTGTPDQRQLMTAGDWKSTTVINSLTVLCAANLLTGSRVSLYGMQ
jgi:hypothetical protein